jgi:hypothetical protein
MALLSSPLSSVHCTIQNKARQAARFVVSSGAVGEDERGKNSQSEIKSNRVPKWGGLIASSSSF